MFESCMACQMNKYLEKLSGKERRFKPGDLVKIRSYERQIYIVLNYMNNDGMEHILRLYSIVNYEYDRFNEDSLELYYFKTIQKDIR